MIKNYNFVIKYNYGKKLLKVMSSFLCLMLRLLSWNYKVHQLLNNILFLKNQYNENLNLVKCIDDNY
ncbi:hypothetical protein CFB3_27450 [Clostridium folliculivorans]|uniref:Uncharacterized protein n=1 Tax=Clostridium folliculivorans TaxID=2886038 RepID=A0A9W6D9P4_9CLOT|nr:hypothetical protein CFOLD11_13660 [Clostridium folliculivorans]GKU30638.1 hypothetical protein CFB3_27450 [Clostridium folliculivorans]